ncbi:MAG: hypothetical protein BHW59_10285 [Desulfovibrio piger]|uniref:hypothetical protein n=1 Tax=Desulfovibrio piger TaxID=901 RepID=UPI0009674FBE|nr:hypothetical protein [Desulfovibrio piger]OLA82991.1 MAG: hypothetical protein BHW59_10285 [Desulfovibrio piger]
MGSFWAAALAQVRSWPRDRLFLWLLLIAPLSGMVILDGLLRMACSAACPWPSVTLMAAVRPVS